MFLLRRPSAECIARYLQSSEEVSYVIRAASQPRARLAMLGYPYVRWLQRRFRRDSARAMQIAASEAGSCRE